MLGTALLVLLPLKWIQVYREPGGGSIVAALASGTNRRLDDPSFWAIAACLIAGWFVRKSAGSLAPPGSRQRPTAPVEPVYYVAWIATGIATAIAYTFAVYIQKEAWFFVTSDRATKIVQRIEGGANTTVALIAPMFFALGIRCLSLIYDCLRNTQGKDERLRRSASHLASAGAGPFISTSIAFALWQVIQWIGKKLGINAEPNVFGTSDVFVAVGALALYATPFLALFFLVIIQLRKCFKFTWIDTKVLPPFGLILVWIGIGAFLFGGYMDAKWRTDQGCVW